MPVQDALRAVVVEGFAVDVNPAVIIPAVIAVMAEIAGLATKAEGALVLALVPALGGVDKL